MVFELIDLILVGLFGFSVGGIVILLYSMHLDEKEKQAEEPPLEPFDDEPSEPEDAFSEELAVILMKEQRLAYEAEEERAKKRAAGAGVKSQDESFRENNGDV